MRTLTAIAALPALLAAALVHDAAAGPCKRTSFRTSLVQEACARGGQSAAKDAMKAFAKQHGIKSCNTCHTKLGPTYALKGDAVDQFAKLGGKLLAATPAPPRPAPAPAPARPTPPAFKPAPMPPTAPTTATAGDPKIEFEKYVLPNGLEVILAPDNRVPLVAVNVWYHVGSGYENYGKSGFAHLFEHMMFQGSRHVGEDRHFAILKKIGEAGVNGTTNLDRTNYFEVVPSNQLATALWLESDRMGYLLQPPEGVDFGKSLANQIEVVRNERRQRYDNAPYGKALFAQFAGLYPEGHPYRYLTIGKHEDLARASVDDVKQFFKTWYVPANATLAIVGDFEPAAAKQLITKWFGAFPNSAKPRPIPVPAPAIKSSETVVSDELAKLRQLRFSWHTPAYYQPGDAELDIIGDALSREGVGRLYRALVYDRPLAQSVQAYQSSAGFSSVFVVNVTLRSGADANAVKAIVADEIAKVTRAPLTQQEIARMVANNEAGVIRGLESLLGRANLLQRYNHYLGDPGKLSWDLDRYRKTTADKIRQVAATYLRPDRVVVTITNPATPGGK